MYQTCEVQKLRMSLNTQPGVSSRLDYRPNDITVTNPDLRDFKNFVSLVQIFSIDLINRLSLESLILSSSLLS